MNNDNTLIKELAIVPHRSCPRDGLTLLHWRWVVKNINCGLQMLVHALGLTIMSSKT